jgi:hypothetical protein
MKTESASRPFNRKTKAKAAARKKLKKRADEEYNRKDSKIGEGDIYAGIYKDGEYADSGSQSARELRKLLDKAEAGRPMRPKMIGGMSGGSTKGIDPRDNYSEEDLKTLLRSSGSAKGMMGGGKVKGYKHGGAVMAGRGGTFKGCK